MRKYKIITKVAGNDGQFSMPVDLEPIVHKNLYDIPDIAAAIEFMREHPDVQMVGIRKGTRYYGVAQFENTLPIEKCEFTFDEPESDS